MASSTPIALGLATLAALLCALPHPAVRRALDDGRRCLARYPDAWRLPAGFGLTYGLFQLVAAALLLHRSGDDLVAWLTWHEFTPSNEFAPAWRPALDTTAATFHFLTLTFPLSALFALRFLLNVESVFGKLSRALGGWITTLLALSALAALAKPFIYLFLPELTDLVPHPAIFLLSNALITTASIFELSLGVFFVTYFLLTTRLWIRGSQIDHRSLVHLTARRVRHVARWAGPAIALAFFLVLLPRFVAWSSFLPDESASTLAMLISDWAVPAYAAFLLLTAPIPITLTFRNLKLPTALAAAISYVAQNFFATTLFLAFALIANLTLAKSAEFLLQSFGPDSAAALGGSCVIATLQGALAGWLVVSWTCLYKSKLRSRNPEPRTSP